MNPPEHFSPDDPREWLNRAKSNLALAKSRVPDAYLEDLCFEAQQAAEKAIKAVLLALEIDYPYTHDLAHLLSLLEEIGRDRGNRPWDCACGRGAHALRRDHTLSRTG